MWCPTRRRYGLSQPRLEAICVHRALACGRAGGRRWQTTWQAEQLRGDGEEEIAEPLYRMPNRWRPSGAITTRVQKKDDPTALLVRAGFIRQAHSGVFHLLPAAFTIHRRIEEVLRACLGTIAADEVSLSSISSEQLWKESGRIGDRGLSESEHQFLTIRDRKESGFILSPTHEEEMTRIVADLAKSYKDFPLRLYQINRKYRDELRPRHGLLRTKEFVMKDLYTFDVTEEEASKTYHAVSEMYKRIFSMLGIPFVRARASSGDMGGSLSHEFHVLSDIGEDLLHICDDCGYAENDEVSTRSGAGDDQQEPCPECSGNSFSRRTAIELGHTFLLGTRYSEPLKAKIQVPNEELQAQSKRYGNLDSTGTQLMPLQMGCHGIGVSRLIGAAAAIFADEKGLRWPLVMAPQTVMVILEEPHATLAQALFIKDVLEQTFGSSKRDAVSFTVGIDDRSRPMPWKLKDVELSGTPIVIVMGRQWMETSLYDVRCRMRPELSRKSNNLLESMILIQDAFDVPLSGPRPSKPPISKHVEAAVQDLHTRRDPPPFDTLNSQNPSQLSPY